MTYDYTVQACAGTNCGGWTSASVTVEAVPVLARVAQVEGITSATYIHTDALHSSVVETDGTGAAKPASRPKYEAYGNPTTGFAQPPSQLDHQPGYTGHVMDAATQLVYMQQRYYDPVAGRVLSTDPVAASFNRYAYANNNPYKYIDPDGRRDIYIGGAADKNRTRIVQDYADAQKQLNPGRDVQYFSYKEKAAITTAVNAPLKEGEPLNVIAHSLGGREAINQANSTEVKITNLVIIDPVGGVGDGAKSSNVETWTNVLAAPSDRNSSDTVASAGRMFLGTTETSGASSQTLNTSHGEFPSMMSDSGAQKKVDASYQDRKNHQ